METEHSKAVAVPFAGGGFDLFCEHFCLDHILPASEINAMVEASPSYASGPATAAAKADPMEDGADESLEDFTDFLTGAADKLTNDDMTKTRMAYAKDYLASYAGDFEFLTDLQTRKSLSVGQARGVANCMRAELQRNARNNQTKTRIERTEGSAAKELDLSSVPSGMYASPEGDTRLKVRINNVTKGKWDGWVFVSDGAEYGQQQRYGKQPPAGIYQGSIVDELEAIAADPKAAMAAYGRLTGSCGRCGRILEDEDSIAAGIGPVCAKKM